MKISKSTHKAPPTSAKVPGPRLGRPRAFDQAAAVEAAMHVFWRKGFEAASLAELTAAMGINPPSLYAAFGNKQGLFERVLQHYADGLAKYVLEALKAPTARQVAERRLFGAVDMMCDPSHAPGCLAVQATALGGDTSSPSAQRLVAFNEYSNDLFVNRFERAKAEGDLPETADPTALARYITTIAQGISIQAASGTPRVELRRMVKLVLERWPTA